jgi:LuxR family transcriptional regulator, glucitol operon activator
MAVSLQRLTLFALISAIEGDARILIAEHVLRETKIEAIFDEVTFNRAADRMKRSEDLVIADQPEIALLDFFDIGDYVQALFKFKSRLPKGTQTFLTAKSKYLETMIGIRNRVMHGRPLDFDDLPFMKGACEGSYSV